MNCSFVNTPCHLINSCRHQSDNFIEWQAMSAGSSNHRTGRDYIVNIDQHCEYVTTKLMTYRILGKSVSYIAIIVTTVVAALVIIMDILKETSETRRRLIVQRLMYVNAPETVSQLEQDSSV
ncbi:unnamed protein product [Adineta ricciae]|uniref:Uncharacterized protein n=1 Tax=Adineta ricciae TaxID=249248 RepID=A0A814YLL7_ADIRI|nr:unnamed protein product [Adineta ricciae]